MNLFAGIAQHPEHRRTLPAVAGENPAPRSMPQAFAAGLQLDPATIARGRADGAAGRWRLTAADLLGGRVDALAYATGFVEGRRFGPNPHGG